MKWFKQLFSRRRLYDDLSEEIQEHLEQKIEELVAGGMSRKEVAAAPRPSLSSPAPVGPQIAKQCHLDPSHN
jgi:hypothetical protein